MNGSVSRRIRRSVFGEYSLKKREYGVLTSVKEGLKRLVWPEQKVKLENSGQVYCVGLRSKYLAIKKGYKAMKRRGIKNPLAALLK